MEVQHRAGKAQGWMGLWAGVLDLLFPPRCQVCGTLKEPPLCEDCRARIVWFSLPRCLRCGRPFDPLAHGGSFCAECRRHRRLGFTAARALGPFEGCLREAIHRLKYGGRRALAQPLGELLIEFLQTDPEARLGLRLGEVSFLVP
ncbi:MAG TPA: ComF family protein, partial [Armatimonadetes bacterium]|nr:ComF family protein [Armatimonadota bacterium]